MEGPPGTAEGWELVEKPVEAKPEAPPVLPPVPEPAAPESPPAKPKVRPRLPQTVAGGVQHCSGQEVAPPRGGASALPPPAPAGDSSRAGSVDVLQRPRLHCVLAAVKAKAAILMAAWQSAMPAVLTPPAHAPHLCAARGAGAAGAAGGDNRQGPVLPAVHGGDRCQDGGSRRSGGACAVACARLVRCSWAGDGTVLRHWAWHAMSLAGPLLQPWHAMQCLVQRSRWCP